MRCDIRKMKSRGFGLVEMLIVIVILGILAGMTMLALGKNTDSTEAALILAHLDSAKSALLAYSMENRTRNTDPLASFASITDDGKIHASLDKYLESQAQTGGGASTTAYFNKLRVQNNGARFDIGFVNFQVQSGIASALDKKVKASGGTYTGSGGAGTYSLWLRVR